MTKRLDPDIKAMRAVNRALSELPDDHSVRRVLNWTIARAAGRPAVSLPQVSWVSNQESEPN